MFVLPTTRITKASDLSSYDLAKRRHQLKANKITSHLINLLNTRQGSVAHMPDFGLPDLTEVYKGIPSSIAAFKQAMLNTINKYEPRLKNVEIIESRDKTSLSTVLKFKLVAELDNGNKISFTTDFLSEGRALIEFNEV